MKKGFTVAALIMLVFNITYSQAPLSKDEAKKVKEELKNYMKHPEQYKAKMDEQQTNLDNSAAQVKNLTASLEAAKSDAADLQKKIALSDDQTKLLQEENDKLKEAAAKEKDNDLKNTPKGTVYKIQLGMYRGLNLNKYFDQPRYIGYEEVDGMNRYVISYFSDEETAQKFKADIRKLGVKDAFVAKYIDGVRVYEWSDNPKYKGKKVPATLEEALNSQPKKGKKK